MNLKALAHLNCFQSIEITKFWILAVAKIHNSEQQVKWYAILMVNFELLCTTMIPPPWCDGSLSSGVSVCLRHKNMVHLHVRAFATTRPWFISDVHHLLQLRLRPPSEVTFICTSCYVCVHLLKAGTSIRSYVYVHLQQLRASGRSSYVHLH